MQSNWHSEYIHSAGYRQRDNPDKVAATAASAFASALVTFAQSDLTGSAKLLLLLLLLAATRNSLNALYTRRIDELSWAEATKCQMGCCQLCACQASTHAATHAHTQMHVNVLSMCGKLCCILSGVARISSCLN